MMTDSTRLPVFILLGIALGGSLLFPELLAGALLLLAAAGGWVIASGQLPESAWTPSKELRLIHFAFWFFVLAGGISWGLNGFDRDGLRTLAPYLWLLLFWPLAMALTWSGLRATHLFLIVPLIPAAAILSAGWTTLLSPDVMQNSLDGKSSPLFFDHLALLGSSLTLMAGVFFYSSNRKGAALTAFLIAITGLAIALLSAPHLLIILPALLVAPAFLLERKARLTALALIGAVIIGLLGFSERATDLLFASDFARLRANGDAPGFFSLALILIIPLAAFARQITHPHKPAACLAAAGAMVPVSYLLYGLTEPVFEHGLLLIFYLISVAALAVALFNEILASYTRSRSVTVSATVITKNEEDHIADCLASARLVADEIIVLDSGSTDRTVEIARQFADVVEVTDWPGFGIQKQRALARATGDWVLSIDADERITPDLAREINHHLAAPDADAYKLPWAVTLYGKRLDFGRSGRAPLRLFRREGVRFSDAQVHEKILLPKGRNVKNLRGRLTHYTHRNFGHALEKSAKYAWLGSNEKARKGKKTSTLLYPTFRGLLTFLQVYIIRGGFLDGSVGYLVAVTYAQGSFNKYAGLWTLGRHVHSVENKTED